MALIEAANPGTLEVLGRLLLATGVGALIGMQRELAGHEAGVRTHALLSLGAGLFGLISVGAFGDFVTDPAATNVQIDVTRIASYVAAGIGFIGAGAILKGPHRIHGLTTSASLWVTAAAGLAAGLGFWLGAVAAAVLTVVVLLLERPLKALSMMLGGKSSPPDTDAGDDDPDRRRALRARTDRDGGGGRPSAEPEDAAGHDEP